MGNGDLVMRTVKSQQVPMTKTVLDEIMNSL